MKTSCEVIRDLLPLYCDGVCSGESREMVRGHLEECEKCREELRAMDMKIETASVQIKEDTAIKAAAAAWKKGKGRAFLKGCLIALSFVFILVACYYGYHWFSTVDTDDLEGLAEQAAKYGNSSNLVIKKVKQRGNFLAIVCSNAIDEWTTYIFDRDDVFENRWRVGGSVGMGKGQITHWNSGIRNESVLVFCGREIPEEVDSYMFYNDGTRYIRYIKENDVFLDVFVMLDSYDINGYPTLFDANGREIQLP